MTVILSLNEYIFQRKKMASKTTKPKRIRIKRSALDALAKPVHGKISAWSQLSAAAFNEDWDNPEDAIYDNWRTLYASIYDQTLACGTGAVGASAAGQGFYLLENLFCTVLPRKKCLRARRV
jgi:hypothetical protein